MNSSISNLKSIIESRRSIFPKSYTSQPIEDSLIEEILESAIYAPTHKRTEPWRFVVFKDAGKGTLASALAELYKSSTTEETFLEKKYNSFFEKAEQAGCIIAIVASLHPEKLPEWEEIAAVGCAVQNIALTSTAHGLGGYWSSPGPIAGLGTFLALEGNEKCLGLYYLGYHNEDPRNAIRTPIARKLTWVKG